MTEKYGTRVPVLCNWLVTETIKLLYGSLVWRLISYFIFNTQSSRGCGAGCVCGRGRGRGGVDVRKSTGIALW